MIPARLVRMSPKARKARLRAIRDAERELLVEFLWHLVAIEEEKQLGDMGGTSMYRFLTEGLDYANATAYRRVTAAKLLASYPVVADYLADGRLNLTKLCALRDVLAEHNVVAMLDSAIGLNEEQVKAMVAGLLGKPMAPSRIILTHAPAPPAMLEAAARAREEVLESGDLFAAGPVLAAPVTQEFYEVYIQLSKTAHDKLQRAIDALSHKIPDRDLAKVMEALCDQVIAHEQLAKEGTGERPRPTDPESVRPGKTLHHEIMERDGRACRFTTADGTRCGSTHRLEPHHIIPRALGGLTVADNLEMLCHRHNQDMAWLELGAERMRAIIASGPEAPEAPEVNDVDDFEIHDDWIWEDPPELTAAARSTPTCTEVHR